ncbi:hypothetical protein KAR48_14490, partial [bacterium]|nr:hypothetical protein [bacterium]
MKVKKILFGILILISVLIVVLILFEHVPKEYAASDKYRLVWNDDPTSTMTIIWDQLKGDEATVLYSKKDFGRK